MRSQSNTCSYDGVSTTTHNMNEHYITQADRFNINAEKDDFQG
jgi:hypothetical protein